MASFFIADKSSGLDDARPILPNL